MKPIFAKDFASVRARRHTPFERHTIAGRIDRLNVERLARHRYQLTLFTVQNAVGRRSANSNRRIGLNSPSNLKRHHIFFNLTFFRTWNKQQIPRHSEQHCPTPIYRVLVYFFENVKSKQK